MIKKRQGQFYAQDHGFNQENQELPDQFKDQIFCADSEKFLKLIPDNSIDIVFTSPPYNFGMNYDGSDDAEDWPSYFNKLYRIFDQCIRVVKYGGRVIINVQPMFSDYIPTHHLISNYLMDQKMIWKAEILWDKSNYNCAYTAWGSWKSPSSPYFKYTWEFLEVFCKGDLKKPGKPELADITGDEFKKWVLAKWDMPGERRGGDFGHPAMMPEALAARVLKLFSFQGDTVLDPFAGVGTVPLIAQNTGRHYIGIDISEEYCINAMRRLQNGLHN